MTQPDYAVSNNARIINQTQGYNQQLGNATNPTDYWNQITGGASGFFGQNQEAFFALQRELLRYQFLGQIFNPETIKAGGEFFSGLLDGIGSGSKSSSSKSDKDKDDEEKNKELAQNSNSCGGCCDGQCDAKWQERGAKTQKPESKNS